jgi:branched-chain amino acid transport system substrate-binding protein
MRERRDNGVTVSATGRSHDMLTTRTALGLALAGSIALALPGLASAQDKIRIGAVLAVTGPASFLGDPEAKTLKMLAEQINAKGGLLGKQIEVVIYDSGGDAAKAKQFATRLVEEDKVIAQVGGSTTGDTMAMCPVFQDAKLPLISLAGAVVIIDPVKKFCFKTPHTDKMACEKIFADMKARSISKIGMISGQDAFGKSMQEECKKVVGSYGIEVLADETYGPRDTDMTPQLTNIKAKAGLQAVLNAGFGQGPAIVTRNFKQLGISVPLYQSHGVASKGFIDAAGDAAEGVRLPAAALLVADKLADSDPQKPVVVGYTKDFVAYTKQPVSTFGGHAYDGLNILVEAVKRANTLDGEKIRDEIEKTKGFIGTGGVVNMSPADHMGLDLTAFRMLEIRNGGWALLR